MRWNLRSAIKRYISGSMWLIPVFALLFYLVFARATAAIETWLLRTGRINETTSYLGLSAAGARSMLETTMTLNLSFLVFTFGSLLVAIQVAGGQYTPRIIATTLLRDNVIRFTVGFFVFTLVYSLRVLARMDASVQQFNTFIAVLLGLISVMVFLYLIDYAGRLLRPVSLVERVGHYGANVLENVYPEKTVRPVLAEPQVALGPQQRIVVNEDRPGVVLAVDLAGLVRLAQQADGIIEFVPQMGDFVALDEPLYRLYGGAGGLDEHQLRGAVLLGTERTMEQDPTFAFRILVDIAIKALSAAINDPTTAVLALDQLHLLLRAVGLRALRGETVRDAAGAARLIYRTPNWEDYVHLACAEIRLCGASSVQIMRRMRSMLENLVKTLPPHRHPELRRQLELLDRTIETAYTLAEDRALARIGDPQGLGGSLGVERVSESSIAEGGTRDAP
ncbi:DUF2254 domain-containing protein [Lysobacter rhizosphaerae]